MRNDLPSEAPKTIWQNQPTEPTTMTLEMIQRKARQSASRTQRDLLGNATGALFAVALSVFGIMRAHNAEVRLVFALAIAWVAAGQSILHRDMWSSSVRSDATLDTGLEFYRQELQRRGHLLRRVLLWSFGPLVLSVVTFILWTVGVAKHIDQRAIVSVTPFSTLFVIWIVLFLAIRSRNQKKLQREISDLIDAPQATRQ